MPKTPPKEPVLAGMPVAYIEGPLLGAFRGNAMYECFMYSMLTIILFLIAALAVVLVRQSVRERRRAAEARAWTVMSSGFGPTDSDLSNL